jgi:hypothetical protein
MVDEGLRVESTSNPLSTLNPIEGSGIRVQGLMVEGGGLRGLG